MEKLKPCPFCGGVPRFGKTFVMQSEERQIVYCGKCWSRTKGFDTQEEAADFWNIRVKRSKECRLIDADAIIKRLKEWDTEDTMDRALYNFALNRILEQPTIELKDCTEAAPTIDAEPIKHGHWINTGSGQECSVCREIQYGYDSFRNYCPNCGARMERSE